ncbi:MAG: hypothetical protein Q4G67_05745 [Actinomycetia bacterium]|nr:hypothetical protein [Actinomycetes bacterium]
MPSEPMPGPDRPGHPDSPESADGPHPDGVIEPWARPLGAAVTGAMTLALVALIGFYLYELGIGESDSPIRVIMSVLLFAVFAAVGAAMTKAWLTGATWAATPTLVIGALLVPTTYTVLQAGQLLAGGLLALTALSAVYVGWKGRTHPA